VTTLNTNQPTVPKAVSVALTELAGEVQEGLLALAVGTGLQVLTALMEQDVTVRCGVKGRHDATRTATRHGRGAGSVSLGGRRVPVVRPRMRASDGSGELPLAAYELFSQTEVLGRMAMERMLAGLSTRHYRVGLEPVGTRVERSATATSKSAVSRRFVAATETALAELLAADVSGLDLVALMVDGVHFAEHCCGIALGIDIDGVKHPLSLVEGSTENATLVTDLLAGLRERGLNVSCPILVVIDGSKALRRAVVDVFDHPVIQRCQLHKIRNVQDRLPQKLRSVVAKRMRAAYHADTALAAQAQLESLAGELDRTHPGAAASLREGLTDTLTVLRLDVPPTLARTLRSTNCVESMIEICRDHSRNVKRWRDGQMALRWCAAGMVEAGTQFRRVNGHLHLRALRTVLQRQLAADNAATNEHNRTATSPDDHWTGVENLRNSGHPLGGVAYCTIDRSAQLGRLHTHPVTLARSQWPAAPARRCPPPRQARGRSSAGSCAPRPAPRGRPARWPSDRSCRRWCRRAMEHPTCRMHKTAAQAASSAHARHRYASFDHHDLPQRLGVVKQGVRLVTHRTADTLAIQRPKIEVLVPPIPPPDRSHARKAHETHPNALFCR
jgi:putative transposase